MSDKEPVDRTLGPFCYENWKAALTAQDWTDAEEYPLFTDAHITGAIFEGLGPYQILNAVRVKKRNNRPALILRMFHYLDFSYLPTEKPDSQRYHGGWFSDEVSALISLCLDIRLYCGGCTRRFKKGEDPMGHPVSWDLINDPKVPTDIEKPILPGLSGEHSLDEAKRIATLPLLSPEDATALVIASRLYQQAVWIAEGTPELSWIMLTSAIEAVANRWRESAERPVDLFQRLRPALANLRDCLKRF